MCEQGHAAALTEFSAALGKRPSPEAGREDAPAREDRLTLEADYQKTFQKRLADTFRAQLEQERGQAQQERDQAQCELEHAQNQLKEVTASALQTANRWRQLHTQAQQERDELQKSLSQMRGRNLYDLPDAQLESLLEDIMDAKERVEKMQLRRKAEALVLAAHPDYACPISLAIMRNPVVAADGQSYERTEIEAWFKSLGEANKPLASPLRAPLKSAQLVPNHSLRRAIEAAVFDKLPPAASERL